MSQTISPRFPSRIHPGLGRVRLLAGLVALALGLLAVDARAEVEPSAVLLRYPDISDSQVVFRYAGDLWLVPKEGGTALRITSAEGPESFPKFSPDGSQIAFMAGYQGGTDLYVMPTAGGVPRRLTWHPSQPMLCGWTPDGERLLFWSSEASGIQRAPRLFSVPVVGGPPEPLPLAYGTFGSIDASGEWLAFTPITREFRTWKRYQGGMAQDIWLFHLGTYESRRLTDWSGTDAQPMWWGRKVVFVSDRGDEHVLNLWSIDIDTNETEQLTFFEDFGVRFASMGPADVVFENGGKLYRFELATKRLIPIEVSIPGDRPRLLPERHDVSDLVQSVVPGPTGKRVLVEARGELFDLAAEEGSRRLLTGTSGVAERDPAWSPDGRFAAYFSDRSGEYELTLRRIDGRPFPGSDEHGERRLTDLGPGYRYMIRWSPDSSKLAFSGHEGALWIWHLDLEAPGGGRLEEVGRSPDGRPIDARWSATSDWLAWGHRHSASRLWAVYLRDVPAAETHEVTSGTFNDWEPTFDPEGKYLYYLSVRHFAPIYADLDRSWIYTNSVVPMAVPLRGDVAHPLAPKDAEEKSEESSDAEPENGDGKAEEGGDEAQGEEESESEESEAKRLVIELDGFEARAVRLPATPGNLRATAAVKGGLLYLREPNTGADGGEQVLERYDLEKRETQTVLSGVNSYALAASGDRALVRAGRRWGMIGTGAGQKLEKTVDLARLTVEIEPRAEWAQMLRDTWRIFRDFFYDEGLHGLDWPAVYERYAAALADATSREDLHFLTGEMMAELNVGHAYNRTPPGGLMPTREAEAVGLLGADLVLENGAYRIDRILAGEPAETDGRSPLGEPGTDVRTGDYVLAVNGRSVDVSRPFEAAMVGTAGRPTWLTVSDDPSGNGEERRVLVTPLSSDASLRYRDWVADRRRRVHELSGGKVGYLHVPDTGVGGQNELVRQFVAQRHLPALLIDERWNGGGQIPTRFIELLNRPVTNYWGVRHGEDWEWPEMTHQGPKAMLMNGSSGSGGDAFPYYFRQAGLGKLLGTRTWGGLVGISGNPRLVDGTAHAVPTFGFYSREGQWAIEGWGVDPDIEVIDDPTALAGGGDPQLEAGVRHLLEELERNPYRRPARPASPDRTGFGIDPTHR